MMSGHTITVTRRYDLRAMRHRYTVDHFPPVTTFAVSVLDNSDPLVVLYNHPRIELVVDNGHAVYEAIDYSPETRTCLALAQERTWWREL